MGQKSASWFGYYLKTKIRAKGRRLLEKSGITLDVRARDPTSKTSTVNASYAVLSLLAILLAYELEARRKKRCPGGTKVVRAYEQNK